MLINKGVEVSDIQPWEWEKSDIEALIKSQRQEDLNLDYKGSEALAKTDGKKSEITKDISSFANSDGGIIIYGVREFNEAEKRHLPEKIDDGLNPDEISKEWLEQVINSGVKPKIDGLRIKSIGVHADKVIYLVYIPKSTTVHQASDKKYYKRFNFQSIAMEHYEVLDILNRSVKPDLTPSFLLVPAGNTVHLLILLVNNGSSVIENISFELSLPSDMIINANGDSFRRGTFRNLLVPPRGQKAYSYINLTFRNRGGEVIFPEQKFELVAPDAIRAISIRNVPEDPMLFNKGILYWQLYADTMQCKRGEVVIGSIEFA